MTTDLAVAQDVAALARRAYAVRLQTGNGGNLSARLPDGRRILIKPSGVSFADCEPEDLVEVDLDTGRPIDGVPSSELHSHLEIYRKRPDIGGVFHCHAPWSIACAETHDVLPAIARHATHKIGTVPVLRFGPNPEAAIVATAIGQLVSAEPDIRAFVEAEHGIFSFAATLDLAFYNAELVEETAQIALLSRLARSATG